MYADDTSLTVGSDNANILKRQINHDTCEVRTWLKANKLNLNITKTKYMIIASRHRIRCLGHQLRIEVCNQPLKREKVYKYLGLEIDESIIWKDHINKISKKISGGIGALKRVRHLVPSETLLIMYNSLALPYFDYCSAVWGNCNKELSDKLQKLQNRAARVVTFSDYNRHSSELLNELMWDNLKTRRYKQLAVIMYNTVHSSTPTYLTRIFENVSSVHLYNLRHSDVNIYVPRPNTETGKNSFHYKEAILWNGLSNDVKCQLSLRSLKELL